MTIALPRRTYLYFAAQSVNLTAAVMSVTMSAIVGYDLAPKAAWSTAPYGFQFLFLMLATYPASHLMSKIGRRRSFLVGALPLAASGLTGYYAVTHHDFILLIGSHAALGIYIAFANFNRFAATDGLDQNLRPKAISLVVTGGLLAAFLGPAFIEWLRTVDGYNKFALCYASFIGLAGLSMLLAFFLPNDSLKPIIRSPSEHRVRGQKKSSDVSTFVSMAAAALGYGIMNLLMIQASMHMNHVHEDFSSVRVAIQWHVVAMFLPSLLTGTIIQKLGSQTTICLGIALLIACAAVNFFSTSYSAMILSLVILGLGWNLTYVGGGALLDQSIKESPDALRTQGKNDLAIAICATIGAFSPSLLFSLIGWKGTNIFCATLASLLLIATMILLHRDKNSTLIRKGFHRE